MIHSATSWTEGYTLEHLKAAFCEIYNNNDISGYRKTADLWCMRQKIGQSTADFSAKVEQQGTRIGFPAGQLIQVVLNGLRPAIRQHVTLQRPQDLAAVRELN